jgi:hypothetical protein
MGNDTAEAPYNRLIGGALSCCKFANLSMISVQFLTFFTSPPAKLGRASVDYDLVEISQTGTAVLGLKF